MRSGPSQLLQCRLVWSNKLPERLRIHMVYLLTAKCGVMRRTKCAPQLLLAEIGNCHLSCAPGFQNQMHQGQHHNHCRAAVILAAGATTGVGARTQACIYIYICINVYTYICIYVYMYVYMYVYVYVYMFVCVYICMYACIYACIYVCMYACMYVCMHGTVMYCNINVR